MTESAELQPWWKRWLRRNWKITSVAAVFWGLGLYMGWGSGESDHSHHHPSGESAQTASAKPKKKVIWTCSMHPQIRLPKKGKCPICFMDLTPLAGDDSNSNPRRLAISKASKALAEIRTSKVERRPVSVDVRMVGKIAYDETLVKTITAWVPGRLERMYVDYTGVRVRRGDHLVKIYSPELVAAQQELLQAAKAYQGARRSTPLVRQTTRLGLEAARRKLELLGVRRWQIRRIEKRKTPQEQMNIYAPLGGIVIKKQALQGMYVKTGTPLYTIADLSKVWIKFDAYERDLPWLHVGQDVTFKTLSMPGQAFKGRIVYIDPVLNSTTRTVSVRVNARNPQGRLKPDMFVRGVVHVSLNARGQARIPERKGKYVCPMHPEVINKRRSLCTICGMRLERIRRKKEKDSRDPIVIPATAPLLTGQRAVVYVEVPKTKKPTYEGREVELGPNAGNFYVVFKGLKEGEQVVTHGAFKIDSELQLQARPSMMSLQAKSNKKDITKVPPRPKISQRRLRRLDVIYATYFAITQALVKDNPKAAQKAFKKLTKELRKLRVLPGKGRALWAKHREALFVIAQKGKGLSKAKTLRKAFQPLAMAMIDLERTIGHAGMKPYYLAYCPMAFNNTGGYWLQKQKGILNPYFGKKMLVCGEVKATYIGREAEPVKTPKRFLASLSSLYKSYFELQHSLFKDNLKGSMVAMGKLKRAVRRKRIWLLPRAQRSRWKQLRKMLQRGVKESLQKKADIAQLRRGFETLSKAMLQLVFVFGHREKTPLYEAFCPMAFKYKGAAWLQPQDKRVHNSYFGAKMAFCGTIKRRFVSRVASKGTGKQAKGGQE